VALSGPKFGVKLGSKFGGSNFALIGCLFVKPWFDSPTLPNPDFGQEWPKLGK